MDDFCTGTNKGEIDKVDSLHSLHTSTATIVSEHMGGNSSEKFLQILALNITQIREKLLEGVVLFLSAPNCTETKKHVEGFELRNDENNDDDG